MKKATEQIYPVVEFQLRKKTTCFCKQIQALVILRISVRWGPLSADELDKAEEYLVREVQMQHFREEINTLNQQILKNSKLNSLRPYLDDQDNASTFKCANKDIQYFFNIIKDEDFKNFISSEGITWKFIVELASWRGGLYELLMRSIKEPLRKIIDRSQLTFEETMTILAEIENVLNDRPLLLMIYQILNFLYILWRTVF
ncbi:transposable element Tcb2 transposase [Trichonephila clavata]|uniref:Transposable element Tcb2 transposase n=1 Tax=Trichonephila clavata TaxID=2740835 RepID=A0A8X6LM10_TRICU|nr:transposable element Tcb2 transposase [Trichonephila clavata]